MTDYVIAGLVKRRAELAGEMRVTESRLAQIVADLGHLDAVIRLFAPDFDLASLRPKRPRNPNKAKRGEVSRLILDVLRGAPEPMATAAIARGVMEVRGLAEANPKRMQEITKRVRLTLWKQERQQAVRAQRDAENFTLWSIRE